ncbi:MAG: YkgJ family cysteine cluster protein, partial [Thermoanaerobaculaceae bacterium]|nr:YkgJ family cysteine cluster protein [Thermoanaerobaculaceae bacterium]
MSDGWLGSADRALLEAVDGALARATLRAGPHLVCRPGCTDCCIGPFAVNRLDALRLRRGLERLVAADPERAAAVAVRARAARQELRDGFPGDPSTGRLGDDDDAEAAFVERHAGLPCPALDPASGRCELYAHRPLVCRMFGPPATLGGEAFPPCR